MTNDFHDILDEFGRLRFWSGFFIGAGVATLIAAAIGMLT